MMTQIPSYNLVYFKNLLDIAFIKFFDVYNDQFVKMEDGYHLAQSFSLCRIEDFFIRIINEELARIVKPFDRITNPSWYIIIGACNPRDNILLKFRDINEYFPAKLTHMIYNSGGIKYLLREKDIKIDILKFNEACCNTFNHFFSRSSASRNILFLTNKNADCYLMFKILKYLLGSNNCINLKKVEYSNIKSPIVAVNDMIDKYIQGKRAVNKSQQLKMIVAETKQFIELNNVIRFD